MPKSYKICPVEKFDRSTFDLEPFQFGHQRILDAVPPPPQTIIYKARDRIDLQDFVRYRIEHEREEQITGRTSNYNFIAFIRKEIITGFYSELLKILLLSGRKRDILDFCDKTKNIDEIKISTIEVDMKSLLSKLPSVKGVWFKLPRGLITASALFGSHVEESHDFKEYQESGDISVLSFLFEFANNLHPIQVTQDGAIVLQGSYQEISDEIEIVLNIKNSLLDGIFKESPIQIKGGGKVM